MASETLTTAARWVAFWYVTIGEFYMLVQFVRSEFSRILGERRRFTSWSAVIEQTGGDMLTIIGNAIAWPYMIYRASTDRETTDQ